MAALIEVSVDGEGLGYLKSILEQGTGMCTQLLKLPLENGSIFSPLPEGTSVQRAKQFSTGGIMKMREMRHWLATHLKSLSKRFPTGTILLQDIWAKPSDPIVRSAKSGILLTKGEVYYYLKADECDEELVSLATRDVTSFFLVGAFTHWPACSTKIPLGEHAADESAIKCAAEGAEEIFVGAYDQESLVVWRRN
jgi:hypothetical protein